MKERGSPSSISGISGEENVPISFTYLVRPDRIFLGIGHGTAVRVPTAGPSEGTQSSRHRRPICRSHRAQMCSDVLSVLAVRHDSKRVMGAGRLVGCFSSELAGNGREIFFFFSSFDYHRLSLAVEMHQITNYLHTFIRGSQALSQQSG